MVAPTLASSSSCTASASLCSDVASDDSDDLESKGCLLLISSLRLSARLNPSVLTGDPKTLSLLGDVSSSLALSASLILDTCRSVKNSLREVVAPTRRVSIRAGRSGVGGLDDISERLGDEGAESDVGCVVTSSLRKGEGRRDDVADEEKVILNALLSDDEEALRWTCDTGAELDGAKLA